MSAPTYVLRNTETGAIVARYDDKFNARFAAGMRNHKDQTDAYRVEESHA